jgi:hypothetical protein
MMNYYSMSMPEAGAASTASVEKERSTVSV